MKRLLIIIISVIFATLFIPLIIVSCLSGTNDAPPEMVSVYVNSDDEVKEMEVNQYIKCVVAAEMPVSFEIEALKAQAVAARTYLAAHMQTEAPQQHRGAPVCSDSAHCQAFISEENRRESWGASGDVNWDKISRAVEETDGLIMTFNKKPISAVFHSTSSGKTERAADVWGEDIPYLQSVQSEGDIYSPKYSGEVRISAEDFKKISEENIKDLDWSKGLYGNIVRSESGGIISLDIGGKNIKGTEFRKIFDLNSTNAEIEENGGNVKMFIKGYGHGVGMSQYGADYLAKQGKSFEKILKNYYTGIKVEKW